MLYVKTHLTEDVAITVDITDENVYAQCPGCNAEVPVTLDSVFKFGEVGVYRHEPFCAKCMKTIKRERANTLPPVTMADLIWLEDALRGTGRDELIDDLHEEYEIDSPVGLLESQYRAYGEALKGILTGNNLK